MTQWHDTMVDRPETDGAVNVTGWTISSLTVLGTFRSNKGFVGHLIGWLASADGVSRAM